MKDPLKDYKMFVISGLGEVTIYLIKNDFYAKNLKYLNGFDAEGINQTDGLHLSEYQEIEESKDPSNIIQYHEDRCYYMV